MAEMLEKISFYFQFPFVRYAFFAGIMIALCSSLLGVVLVLKRFSFIGDGLSHVAFGVMAVASVVGLAKDMVLVMPVTILFAVLLLKSGQNAKIKGDASVAVISVGSLAIGYLLLNIFPPTSNVSADVCGTLFGSVAILTLTKAKVWLCAGLSATVVLLFILFYDRIFAVTFDEGFAKASGIRTSVYNFSIAVIIAVVIVLAMNLVGSLLISALIIFPSLSAMRIFRSFRAVTVCSAVVSVLCAVLGIMISIIYGTPVGATIVAADILVFLGFYTVGEILVR